MGNAGKNCAYIDQADAQGICYRTTFGAHHVHGSKRPAVGVARCATTVDEKARRHAVTAGFFMLPELDSNQRPAD